VHQRDDLDPTSTYNLLLLMYAPVPTPERTRKSSAALRPSTVARETESEQGSEEEIEEDERDEGEPDEEEVRVAEEQTDVENPYGTQNVYAVYKSEATDTYGPTPEIRLETEILATSSGVEPEETKEERSIVYTAYASLRTAVGRLYRVGRTSAPTCQSSVFGCWRLWDAG
jgi:hypothetical protein